jgi:hypothetical protein
MGMEGAGRRAWETRRNNDARAVRDLYRDAFASPAKAVARRRSVATLKAAGVETVIDLWGGGTSALELVAAGFRVISVDNGSMNIVDAAGVEVSKARKRRALELAGIEGGYETRWGSVAKFAHEADGALLDFCGPWSGETRRTIEACRHMKAVVVTLMADHDEASAATTRYERQVAYEAFLRVAFGLYPWRGHGQCRVLCRYRRTRGHPVWVFVVAPSLLALGGLAQAEREALDPAAAERRRKRGRERMAQKWASMSDEERTALRTQHRERIRERAATEPGYHEKRCAYAKASRARRLAANPELTHAKEREWYARSHPGCRPRGTNRPKETSQEGA